MLKNRISAADFEALGEGLKEHYSKGSDSQGEGYFLQTEDASRLKRSLESERTQKERAIKMVKKLAPDLQLTDDNRDDWAELVDAEAEKLAELREVDLEEVKALKADGKGKDKDETARLLVEAQSAKRAAERDKEKAERDKATIEKKVTRLQTENDELVRSRDIGRALDEAKITDPTDREIATAIFSQKGVVLRDVGEGEAKVRETYVKVDGQEVPVTEFAKDFAASDIGKRLIKAPDHVGAGEGPEQPTRQNNATPQRKAGDPPQDPIQRLAGVFDKPPTQQVAGARR